MRLYNVAVTALFSAFIVICAWISIPFLGVPFTMQTFGVFLAVSVLGIKRGTAAVGLYILLGLVGLPVFHSFQSGAGIIMGSTGGFIIGLLVAAPIVGLLLRENQSSLLKTVVAFSAGQAVVYISGVTWFCLVYGSDKSLGGVLLTTVVPFLVTDAFKIFAAAVISKRVAKYIK